MAIEYERELYAPQYKNWPDLRRSTSNFDSCRWCHGATGIGISRLGIFKATGDDNFLPEAVIAVETTLADGLGSTDDLCCGTAGKVDYLLEASRHLKEPVFTINAWGCCAFDG